MAAVVIGENGTPAEVYAAADLARYVTELTSEKLPIARVDNERSSVPVGTLVGLRLSDNNSVIADPIEKIFSDPTQLEGYVLATVELDGRPVAALVCSHRSSDVYPVYQLLKHKFGYGFSEDGDYVPRHTTLAVGPLQVADS